MSVWADIRKKSLGQEQRLEDKTPILVAHMKEYISRYHYQIEYQGRINANDTNDFYPKGLVEYFKVKIPITINGIQLCKGDALVGCQDRNYEYDYYVYSRKQPMIL